MIPLPNGCMRSRIAVHPKNWKDPSAPMDKTWYITYRFYNADKVCKQVSVRGMNQYDQWLERKDVTACMIGFIETELNKGYNPFTGQTPSAIQYEIDPDTPLFKALEMAREKVKCSPHTQECIKSMIKCASISAERVNIYNLPISQMKRRHIVRLLEQCAIDRKLSAASYNHYRSYLMILFKYLVKVEAIDYNPVSLEIDKEREVLKIRETLSMAERQEVDAHLREKHYNFWRYSHVFFHSGSRTTELFQLQAKSVNLQEQYFTVTMIKGKQRREIHKTIKDIALPFWTEVIRNCKADDYVFSDNFEPGAKPVLPQMPSRYWKKFVKASREKGGLGITADFYSLKHSHTDEIANILSLKEAGRHNGHTSTNTTRIYAVNEREREAERLRKIDNRFA